MNENTCPMTKEELFSLTLHDLKALWKDTRCDNHGSSLSDR